MSHILKRNERKKRSFDALFSGKYILTYDPLWKKVNKILTNSITTKSLIWQTNLNPLFDDRLLSRYIDITVIMIKFPYKRICNHRCVYSRHVNSFFHESNIFLERAVDTRQKYVILNFLCLELNSKMSGIESPPHVVIDAKSILLNTSYIHVFLFETKSITWSRIRTHNFEMFVNIPKL
jgi:hypothetical protein